MTKRSLLLLAAPIAALAHLACGGAPPTMQGREGMLSQSTIAQKCTEAARGHERPFVIEWDATDLASFEAKAARDTIVVRYEGCKIDVLYQCSDPQAAGRFGAYGTPQFTSGGQQGLDVRNEGELYAKLPLGAATLSGRVQAGEALHLKYFVSGVSTDTRDAVYRGELAPVAGCAGATHFVWAYNVGAFELGSSSQTSGEGKVGVGAVGAGGSRSHEEASVGAGGKLASCETQDQRACRVPIRLALRAIADGNAPQSDVASGAAAAPASPTAGLGSAEEQAKMSWKQGMESWERGDGAACVTSLDRAASLDMRLLDKADFKRDHAVCVMASGRCDDGKKDYRAALASADFKRKTDDFQLDRLTRQRANEACSATSAKNDSDYVIRSFHEMKKAAAANDSKGCAAMIEALGPHYRAIRSVPRAADIADSGFLEDAQRYGSDQYTIAAICVAKSTKKCADGLAIYRKQCDGGLVGCREVVDKSFAQVLPAYNTGCK